MGTLFTIVVFLLVLSFLVVIHELGHLLTALWYGVKVEEIGLGIPPQAKVLFRWRGIPVSLNWLPFGGFVRMKGEDGPDDEKSSTKTPGKAFYQVSKRGRLVVLMAGVVINFVFGVLAFAVVYMNIGIPTPTDEPIIGFVAPGSPAEQAGFQLEDKVIEGQPMIEPVVLEDGKLFGDPMVRRFTRSEEVSQFVNQYPGRKVILNLDRKGERIEKEVYVRKAEEIPAGEGAVGIGFAGVTFKHYPWWQMPFRGMWVGLQQSIGLSYLILQSFGNIFIQLFTKGSVSDSVSGPVGIVHQASKMGIFQDGWLTILNFAGMLSINLAILNALPIPALDGGRAFFVILEKAIGSKRRENIEGKLNYFGFGVLLSLILLITLKDLWVVIKDLL
jgi:regulator of sigma E protease